MEYTLYLPYYEVHTTGGGSASFYVEARISSLLPPVRVFLLATPKDLGFERVPASHYRLDPLPPGDVERLLENSLRAIVDLAYSGRESFDVGGFRGLLRIIFGSFLGRREDVTPTPALEARLALDYVRNVLGVEEGSRFRVSTTPIWLQIRITGESIYTGRGERMRVLERLAAEHPEIGRILYRR